MTSRRVRRWTAVAATAWALALAMPVAHAAEGGEGDEVTIDHVEAGDERVSLILSTDKVPAGTTVSPESVEVAVDGRAVEATVEPVAGGKVSRSTIIVLDTSDSMEKDGRYTAAAAAINTFLDTAPDDVSIGLVTFAGRVTETVTPTTDHDAIRSVMAGVELKKGTSVYDAISEGIDLAGTDGSRSLLVLSDGADTSSATTLDVVTGEALEAGVVVDVVSLASAGRAEELSSLADETSGAVIPAELGALKGVLAAQADALAQQLLVTFTPPAEASEEIDIDVTVAAGSQTYHDSAFATLPAGAAAPDVVESGKALVSRPVMLIGAAAVALGLAGLLATVLVSAVDTRSGAERRLEVYFSEGEKSGRRKGAKGARGKSDVKDSAIAMTDRVVSENLEARISRRLAGAGSALTASEWLLLHVGIAVGSAFVGFVMSGPAVGVLGLVLGTILPWLYMRRRHSRRLAAFNGQLAETLGLMAGGLQAGLSLPQSVDSVVREGNEPMAGELRRALVEQRLGVDITDALDSVGHRMESDDFAWVVMAVRIQREVGGNLAEILHTVGDTLREREYLRRQVKALSAEGRLSGYILTGLPPLIGLYMMWANPDYIRLLYTTVPGFIILALAAVFLGLGSFAMSKLSKVEV